MSKLEDLSGNKFDKLTVIGYSCNNKHGARMWKCKCDCGGETTVSTSDLKKGHATSCGCKHSEAGKRLHQKYENTKTDGVVVAALKKRGWSKHSKYKGVSFHKCCGKYVSHITLKQKTIHLGYFNSEEEAYKARTIAERILHRPFLLKEGNEKKENFLVQVVGLSKEEAEQFLGNEQLQRKIEKAFEIIESGGRSDCVQ